VTGSLDGTLSGFQAGKVTRQHKIALEDGIQEKNNANTNQD
jgi:hypothetical protein